MFMRILFHCSDYLRLSHRCEALCELSIISETNWILGILMQHIWCLRYSLPRKSCHVTANTSSQLSFELLPSSSAFTPV